MVKEDRFMAAFSISTWWKTLWANKGGFFVAYIVVSGLGMLLWLGSWAVVYTVILCWLLPLLGAFAGTYLYLVVMPIFAQAYYQGGQILSARQAERASKPGAAGDAGGTVQTKSEIDGPHTLPERYPGAAETPAPPSTQAEGSDQPGE
jgi:hypothetical protein